eukprot:TRINITY_DN5507_c2_g1_i1.p1 TRINITY_DN5507_c2_g1~~TRINITY_DN5507_c2_g1_i1.p1  ORF type:complete len:159 (-),score=79.80 TRINITY_DN5507_c2_g1_i1:102-578(-)
MPRTKPTIAVAKKKAPVTDEPAKPAPEKPKATAKPIESDTKKKKDKPLSVSMKSSSKKPKESPSKSKPKKEPKPKKDPNAPKRPPSSYLFFCSDKRAEVKEELGAEAKLTDVTRALAEKWKETSTEEKKKYEDQAKAAKEKYQEDLKAYEASKMEREE